MIGTESRSAIHPSRSSPTARTIAPVTSAVREVRAIALADPVTARWATAAANSGAIVESAPTETVLLDPNREEGDGRSDEGPKCGRSGHPGKSRGGELLGNRDHEKRHPRHHVCADPRALVTAHGSGKRQPHRTTLCSGRLVLSGTETPGRPLLLSAAGVTQGPAAGLHLMPIWLTEDEMRKLEAVVDRLIPPDDGPGDAPGALEAGAAEYIDGFLGAFSVDPPRIWAGGPTSGRFGGPAGYRNFHELSALDELAWRTRIEGSLGMPEREFNGPVDRIPAAIPRGPRGARRGLLVVRRRGA